MLSLWLYSTLSFLSGFNLIGAESERKFRSYSIVIFFDWLGDDSSPGRSQRQRSWLKKVPHISGGTKIFLISCTGIHLLYPDSRYLLPDLFVSVRMRGGILLSENVIARALRHSCGR
jgi:hypothetical protein